MGTTKEIARLGTMKKVVISVILAVILLSSMVVPSKKAEALVFPPMMPYVASGRILTPMDTGDISNWIEIARFDGYSLILRQTFLSVNTYAGTWGDPTWNYVSYGQNNSYSSSKVREMINGWFNGTAGGYADKLSPFAPLRQYTMTNNAINVLGTRYTETTLFDGISLPMPWQSGYGNDVAFALSYSEVANYCSIVRNWKGAHNNPADCYSPFPTVFNFMSTYLPPSPKEVKDSFYYGMWLRSPGAIANTASALLNDGYAHELNTYLEPIKQSFGYGLVYPALWVSSDIFVKTGTVNVKHVYADTNVTFDSETHVVNAGPYGPYPAKNLAGYTAVLAPGSDPASGYINAGETKNVTWMYSRVQQATINVLHLDLQSFVVLELENHSIPAGNYGPYLPKSFPGYGDGTLFPGSASPSGTIAGGETKTIIYGYNKIANNIVVRHEATNGTLLREDSYRVQSGLYGPYSADSFPGYYAGNWDTSSAPPVGFVTDPNTVIVIRFVYEPIIYRGVG